MEGYPNCTGSHSGQQNPQIILRTQLDTLDSQDHVLHLEALELERKKRDLAALRRQLFEKANVSFPGSQGTLSAEEADPREQTHEVNKQRKSMIEHKAPTDIQFVHQNSNSQPTHHQPRPEDRRGRNGTTGSTSVGGRGLKGDVTVITDSDGTFIGVQLLGESACQLCQDQQTECYRKPDARYRPQIWSPDGTAGAISGQFLDERKFHIRAKCDNCTGANNRCFFPGGGIGSLRVKGCIVQPLPVPAGTQAHGQVAQDAPESASDDEGYTILGTIHHSTSRTGREIKATLKRCIGSVEGSSESNIKERKVDQLIPVVPRRSSTSQSFASSSSQVRGTEAYGTKRKRRELMSETPSSSSKSITASAGGSESKAVEGTIDKETLYKSLPALLDLASRLLSDRQDQN